MSPGSRSFMYNIVFHNNPVPMWIENISNVPADLFTSKISEGNIHEMHDNIRQYLSSTKIVDANEAMMELFGVLTLEDLHKRIQTSFLDKKKNPFVSVLSKILEKEGIISQILEVDIQGVSKIIDFRWIRGLGIYRDTVIVHIFDVTSHRTRKAEEEKRKKDVAYLQKLEGLGRLAGGIAHDLNNILMVLMGNLSLFMESSDPSQDIQLIKSAMDAANDASELTKQLLAYAGKGKFHIEYCEINPLLSSMEKMLRGIVPKKIDFTVALEESGTIHIDKIQFKQIVINLILNAIDAIGSQSGKITVRSGTFVADESYLKSIQNKINEYIELVDKKLVFIEISDNGTGISNSDIEKIFNPFFSTKGDGRGFGLSVVQGIVRSHGGLIKVYSEIGAGTTFKLLFPSTEMKEKDKIKYQSGIPVPSKTVLFCDDELHIRNVAKNMLTFLGHETILAKDGEEGIQVFYEDPKRIDLIILDLMMPKKGGIEVFNHIRQTHPDIPILLCSGYNEIMLVDHIKYDAFSLFLQKPYTVGQLEEAIMKLQQSSSGDLKIE